MAESSSTLPNSVDASNPLPNFGKIIQTLTSSEYIINLHQDGKITIFKDNIYVKSLRHPAECLDISICPVYKSYYLYSYQINNDDIPMNSPCEFIMMLKHERNPDAANSRSTISCTLCMEAQEIDEVPIALPDLRITKPLAYFDHHKYIFWREDIVVCCQVSYACMGRQTGTKFTQSIPVPNGTTAVSHSRDQLHFTGCYGNHTIDYVPIWE